MGILFKFTQCFATDTLGRRIRTDILGIISFQIFQFPQESVIFKIRHRRIVHNIVTVICLRQNTGQFIYSLFNFHIILRFERMYRVPDRQ